jgi:hypothetical protein
MILLGETEVSFLGRVADLLGLEYAFQAGGLLAVILVSLICGLVGRWSSAIAWPSSAMRWLTVPSPGLPSASC